MQNATLWRALLGVGKTVIEGIEFDEDEQLLAVAARKQRSGAVTGVCLGRFAEGLSAQVLHVGPHGFIAERGYVRAGKHRGVPQ